MVLEEETEGGMLIPDTHSKSKYGAGEVLALEGYLKESSLNSIKPGDIVYFDTILLTCVKIKGEELKFIKFSDILGYETKED